MDYYSPNSDLPTLDTPTFDTPNIDTPNDMIRRMKRYAKSRFDKNLF